MRHAKISSGLKMHQTKIEVRFQTVSENVCLPSNFGGVLGAVVGLLACPTALNAMRSNIEKRCKTEPSVFRQPRGLCIIISGIMLMIIISHGDRLVLFFKHQLIS